MQSKPILKCSTEQKEVVGDGIVRQLLGYDESILLAKLWFEEGAVGSIHTHEHTQVTYIESGIFDVVNGDRSERLVAGDSMYMEPNISHGVTCVAKGVLVDAFSPVREDFLAEEQTS